MPFVKVEAAKVSKEQKAKLIACMTENISQILGVDASACLVLVKENSTDNWGVGGKVLTDVLQKK